MNRNLLWLIGNSFMRMAVLLVLACIAAFFLVTASPVDPLQTNIGQAALGSMSPAQIEKMREYWGVDQPPIKRFAAWAGDFMRGDMGTSLLYRRPVSQVIQERLSSSLWLLVVAWCLSGGLGLALGILAGMRKGSWLDRMISVYTLITASTPAFWLALVLLLIFAVWLKILPIGLSIPIGMEAGAVTVLDRVRHAILPAVTLSLTGISSVTLHTREKMIQIMDSDFVLYARARGEKEWEIVCRHGVRNVLLPAVTLQFASVGEIIGGAVLVEQVFSYPGLGQAAVTAGLGGDVPLLLGITVISAAIVFAGNGTANILYGLIDPRLRKRRT